MDACHLILGRPWQYDIKAIHKGHENTYEFDWLGKRIVLLPMRDLPITSSKLKRDTSNLFSILPNHNALAEASTFTLALMVKGLSHPPL